MKLFTLLGMFFTEIEYRISRKESQGWTGWWRISDSEYERRIIDNLKRRDWIDVAGLAFTAWAKHRNKKFKEEKSNGRK